jgi:hypothetical protein
MTTPAAGPATQAETAHAELGPLIHQMWVLANEAGFAIRWDNDRDLESAAERLLPLHVEFARLYRSWLAARTRDGERVLPPGESMST